VGGIPSAEAFGTADVYNSSITTLEPVGIASGQVVGTPALAFVLTPLGIPSGLVFGSTVVNPTVTSLLASGTTVGSAQVTEGDLTASGIVYGTGTLSGSHIRIIVLDPVVMGRGSLLWSGPLPVYGMGSLVSLLEVMRYPRPVCPCETPRVFQWNQWFQIGDLELHPKDAVGLPYSPTVIVFAFYRILPGGAPLLVGDPNRRPVQQGVGHYYVTGTAGEGGQPGKWFIEWRWQRNWDDEPQTHREHFHVHAHNPCHSEPEFYRGRTQGWEYRRERDWRPTGYKKGWF
jgi:hypothetical protein